MAETLTAAEPMGPGVYMRKRREVAGYTIDVLALMLGRSPKETAAIRNDLTSLERAQPGDFRGLVVRLHGAVHFDPHVYEALVFHALDPAVAVPPVCRNCACSWNDSCFDAELGPCAWSNAGSGEKPLCTRCVGKEPDPAETAEAAAANDREARDAA